MDKQTLLITVGSILFTAMVSFIATRYWTVRREDAERRALLADEKRVSDARIAELERKLGEVGQTVQPLSAAFQAMLIKQLTHMHTPVLDALLVKLGPPVTLTEDEEKELARLLIERTNDLGEEISQSEREAAIMLPYVVKRVRAEQDMPADEGELKVVLEHEDGNGEPEQEEAK